MVTVGYRSAACSLVTAEIDPTTVPSSARASTVTLPAPPPCVRATAGAATPKSIRDTMREQARLLPCLRQETCQRSSQLETIVNSDAARRGSFLRDIGCRM